MRSAWRCLQRHVSNVFVMVQVAMMVTGIMANGTLTLMVVNCGVAPTPELVLRLSDNLYNNLPDSLPMSLTTCQQVKPLICGLGLG